MCLRILSWIAPACRGSVDLLVAPEGEVSGAAYVRQATRKEKHAKRAGNTPYAYKGLSMLWAVTKTASMVFAYTGNGQGKHFDCAGFLQL